MDVNQKSPSVCILISSFFPIVGGGESHALCLSRELTAKGLSVFVITRKSTPSLKKYEEINKVPVYRVLPACSPRLGKYMMLIPAFIKLALLRNRYDIIYVCGLRVLGLAGITASLILRKKCILRSESCGELSGDFIWNSPHKVRITLPKKLIHCLLYLRNNLFKKATMFLSISDVIHKEFLSCSIPEKQIVRIPNGIDMDKYKPLNISNRNMLRTKLKLSTEKIIFSYSGKLNLGKGLELLLRVWGNFSKEFNNAYLLLIGGGGLHFLSCEETLKLFVEEHDLQDSITFTGYVDNVHEFLQCSDCFVFPSENESFGISPLEAMACELPTIATKTGELPKIIKNKKNGFLINSCSETELYTLMKYVINNPESASKVGREAGVTIREYFSIGKVAEDHIKLFNNL